MLHLVFLYYIVKLLYNSSWLFSIGFSITLELIIFAAFKKSGLLVGTLASIEDKILSGNIVKPEVSSTVPDYQGEYVIIPKPFNNKVLKTSGFKMNNNVTVLKIPYYQTSNETGYTVYIGGEE